MNPLSDVDRVRVAALHAESLPDSAVSRLGSRYADSFYRYIGRSTREAIFVERAGDEVAAAAVLSLRPRSLPLRLGLGTSLGYWVVVRFLRGTSAAAPPSGTASGVQLEPAALPASMPELILVFTGAGLRSTGIGFRLLEQCERFLLERGLFEYAVRTVADSGNRALAFYARNGFVEAGQATDQGRVFQVFTKALRRPVNATATIGSR